MRESAAKIKTKTNGRMAMAYMALYRKYRPQTFDEVVGQDFVTRILKNQIISGRVGHAYLLTGIRGTGKTTIAKIFARAINCTDNRGGNPCNACAVCREIEKPGVMDIIEIDAASNRGVDEIRDIREKVKSPPTLGAYKVYIIDEVHMLTREAFNALLKTLEEPPAHVVFILATTGPNKLPMTILSRCQRFDIRPIDQEVIADRMRMILQDIGVAMDEDALQFVAARGDHSMRDALSILDQIIDIREDGAAITQEQVLGFLGMADRQTILALARAMIDGAADQALLTLQTLRAEGKDAALILDQLITCFRELLVAATTGPAAMRILGIGEAAFEILSATAKAAGKNRLFAMIDIFLADQEKLRYNDMSAVILEMSVLKACSGYVPAAGATAPQPARPATAQAAPVPPETSVQPKAVADRPMAHSAVKGSAQQPAPDGAPSAPSQPAGPRTAKPETRSDGSAEINADRLFRLMHDQLAKTNPLLQHFFSEGRLAQVSDHRLELRFAGSNAAMHVDMLGREKEDLEKMAQALSKNADLTLDICVVKKNAETMSFAEKTTAIVGDVPIESQ